MGHAQTFSLEITVASHSEAIMAGNYAKVVASSIMCWQHMESSVMGGYLSNEWAPLEFF